MVAVDTLNVCAHRIEVKGFWKSFELGKVIGNQAADSDKLDGLCFGWLQYRSAKPERVVGFAHP
jgi:hypothetical protein